MSQKDDSESDIWDYKPLGKRKKRNDPPSAPTTKTKRRCTIKKTSKKKTSVCVESPGGDGGCITGGHSSANVQCLPPVSPAAHDTTVKTSAGSSSGDFCPMCQMPFSILLVQSQRWHVAECLDTRRDTCKECPDGLQCSSTIPNHYKKFSHTLLAHSRANSDTVVLDLPQQPGASGNNSLSCPAGRLNNEVNGSVLESSQDSFPTSTPPTGTPSSTPKNGLMLLRSPRPEDLKKKKGWSPHSKRQKSVSSSQESQTDIPSTPVKAESGKQACESVPKRDPSPNNWDEISFSPLSEMPTETEDQTTECKKALFDQEASGNESEESVLLFNDIISSEDELLTQFIDDLETHSQVQAVNSGLSSNQPPAENRPDSTGGTEASGAVSLCKSSIQSPQSIVLERLRETLRNSVSLPLKSLNDSSIQSEQPHTASPVVPSSQTSSVQEPRTMLPLKAKNKAAQASGLKQTDIGVFFGLKPLKQEKEEKKEDTSGPSELGVTQVPTLGGGNPRQRKPRKPRQRKDRSETTAETSQGTETAENVKEEAGRGRARGFRGRWRRRVNSDGEVELPQCPFYKKIPGTKFAVDAFQYGEIEGITAYFLTHFHSDHYGGLTKNSTVPIYCNKITGNLVKTKLRVAEEKIHILPMNTPVTVEGVKVVLLDANHCPGAAMLLFSLPDGQTVLHTGDFRADPSMETYPELLSLRVQTLYLDTTYCSPEYTFPRQQEVINFAANRAFELVTLNPRTLVVCGSYSVGKEKVFLALAEILGSKVCLSRDKFNTMCCLESEEVRQRITTDSKAARVHVLPMMQLTFRKLQDYLARFSKQYDQLVAFKPTGWTFSQQVDSVDDIQPQISGDVSIYGIPYSEHSSFLEMKRFVQWLRPRKIIPTVNNGSWASRKAMERCFSEWLSEKEAKR